MSICKLCNKPVDETKKHIFTGDKKAPKAHAKCYTQSLKKRIEKEDRKTMADHHREALEKAHAETREARRDAEDWKEKAHTAEEQNKAREDLTADMDALREEAHRLAAELAEQKEKTADAVKNWKEAMLHRNAARLATMETEQNTREALARIQGQAAAAAEKFYFSPDDPAAETIHQLSAALDDAHDAANDLAAIYALDPDDNDPIPEKLAQIKAAALNIGKQPRPGARRPNA